jgi:hypothetical protein
MYVFSDGFDLYATGADVAGYWDPASSNPSANTLISGRFPGSRALQMSFSSFLIKVSNQNDAVHHINVAWLVSNPVNTGATQIYNYFRFDDVGTPQCCISFRQDGTILFTSGAYNGTVLATFPNAFSLVGQWYSFEFEVVIHPTAGSFRVRTNGATSDSFAATGLNTRVSANSYANRIATAEVQNAPNGVDDFLWRSDPSSVPWFGDIRCLTRMPASDVSIQFTATPLLQAPYANGLAGNIATASANYANLTASFSGTVATARISVAAGWTGNVKCTVFSDVGGKPGAIIASANVLTNPTTGFNLITFPTPFSVVAGTNYWLGLIADAAQTSVLWYNSGATSGWTSTISYASFPAASPTVSATQLMNVSWYIQRANNFSDVAEAQQDGLGSYVYDANVGDADWYGIAPLSGITPASTVLVTTRGFMQKSDPGSRSGLIQLKSFSVGGTVTWNPSDIQGTMTLSNGNLTVTPTSSTNSMVRGTLGATGGKLYFEVVGTATLASAYVGVATSAALAGNIISSVALGFMTLGPSSGNIWFNGSNTGLSLGATITTQTVCVAIDLVNGLGWFRLNNGNWNGSGTANPATGTGGVNIAALFPGNPCFPAVATFSTNVATVNFGATAFAQAIPSGFLPWATVATTVQGTNGATLSTSWQWSWRTDLTDPATGAAWTPNAVNNLQIGPTVTA